MKDLPNSEVYEQECRIFPWEHLINGISNVVADRAPKGAKVLDLMCGPGYFLGKIIERRPDLDLHGLDIDKDFITYARRNYLGVDFVCDDVLTWSPDNKFDVITCTGGIHHIPYDKQEKLIEKISRSVNRNGFCVFGDPYIDDYQTEAQRRLGASKLGYEYLNAGIRNHATPELLTAAMDVMYNDVLGAEYKTSIKKMKPVMEKYFSSIDVHKTWPTNAEEFGDYYIVAEK